RDWHSGWGVRAAVVDLPTATMVNRLIGVVCLTYNLQMHLGQRVSADPVARQRRAEWTVTDRVSWCWCGHGIFVGACAGWVGGLAERGGPVEGQVAAARATPVRESGLEAAA